MKIEQSIKEYTDDRLNRLNTQVKKLLDDWSSVQLDLRSSIASTEGRCMDKLKKETDVLMKQFDIVRREFNSTLEDEKKARNDRFLETNRLIESSKNLVDEHIRQQIESVKALTKAIMARESAERTKSDEEILKTLSDRVEQQEQMLRTKIKEEAEKLHERMKTYHDEMTEIKDSHQKILDDHKALIDENKNKIEVNDKEIKESMYRLERRVEERFEEILKDLELKALLADLADRVAAEDQARKLAAFKSELTQKLKQFQEDTDKVLKDHSKRADAQELAHTMERILNISTQDAIDEKFEVAL